MKSLFKKQNNLDLRNNPWRIGWQHWDGDLESVRRIRRDDLRRSAAGDTSAWT